MAIHLESTRNDDKVQWQVGSAMYPGIARNNSTVSATSPLDFSYCNELSDQDDRRTSSCSPESCDFPSNDRLAFGNTVLDISGRSLQSAAATSLKMNGFMKETRSNSLDWSTQSNISNNLLMNRFPSVLASKRARALSTNFGECGLNENMAAPKCNLLFQRKYSASEALLTSDWKDDRPENVSATIPRRYENKQNGVHSQSQTLSNDVIGTNNEMRFSTLNKFVDADFIHSKHCKASAIGASDVADASTVKKNLVQAKNKSNGFGETDAAEALLGLSEGFYQTSDNNQAYSKSLERSVSKDTRIEKSKLTTGDFSKQLNCDENNPSHQNATENSNSENGLRRAKQSPFHYKKLICKKFVNSMSEPNDEKLSSTEDATAAVETHSFAPNFKQNGRKQSKTKFVIDSSKLLLSAKSTSDAFESNRPLRCIDRGVEFKSFQVNEQKQNSEYLNKPRLAMQDVNAISANNDISIVSEQQNVPSTHNVTAAKTAKEAKKKLTSNLYRVSTSLGSSTESLDVASGPINDSVSSDSDSCDSTDSDSDDDDDDDDNRHESLSVHFIENIPKLKSDYADVAKRKVVLNKPKFCIPASANQATPADAQVANEMKKRTLKRTKSVCKVPSEPVMTAFSNKRKVQNITHETAAASNNINLEPSKLNEIHIKKATFTFTSGRKTDTVTKQRGLTVTSQAASPVERTQSGEKNKTSTRLDSDKLDSNKTKALKRSLSQNSALASDRETFGGFRNGVSFETLSKPVNTIAAVSVPKKKQQKTDSKFSQKNLANVPYDKHRLPRPSARSAALEAQHQLKSKTGRKSEVSSLRSKNREKFKLSSKPSIKRPKLAADSERSKPRPNKQVTQSSYVKNGRDKTNILKQNGDAVVETNKASAKFSLERSSSRRKPTRVFKHQKYTSVSMMSSIQSPRDSATSSEFAIISKPLNLDHRVLLANSIDLSRGSPLNSSVDSSVTSPTALLSSSFRTSPIIEEDSDILLGKKTDSALDDKAKERCKRQQRHLSAVEANFKSDFFKRKHKMKRVLSIPERGSCRTNSCIWRRDAPRKPERSPFQLLSLFPAPASIKSGFAQGELLPGYGPSVSGQRSSLPLRWSKGVDVRDLKQKRQREKWRNMTLDMFCMGATS